VRVIVYTLTDPARPGYGDTHRLIPTLLDAQEAPALALIAAYHERWDIERISASCVTPCAVRSPSA